MDWLNKVFNTIAQMAAQVTQQRPQQRPQQRSQMPRARQEIPTTPRRAFGNLAVQNAARQQQYNPNFLKLLMNTNPIVDDSQVQFRAAAQYDSGVNQSQFTRNGMDPATVTHEGLHAAWRTKTPQQRQQFKAIQFSPGSQNVLNKITSSGVYKGLAPDDQLNEMHSFGSERIGQRQNPSANEYYKQYFSRPAKPSMRSRPIMEQKHRNAYLNFNGPRIGLPRINQNSFWRDN